jgi:hypothetical protein
MSLRLLGDIAAFTQSATSPFQANLVHPVAFRPARSPLSGVGASGTGVRIRAILAGVGARGEVRVGVDRYYFDSAAGHHPPAALYHRMQQPDRDLVHFGAAALRPGWSGPLDLDVPVVGGTVTGNVVTWAEALGPSAGAAVAAPYTGTLQLPAAAAADSDVLELTNVLFSRQRGSEVGRLGGTA